MVKAKEYSKLCVLITIVIVLLDQLTKYLIITYKPDWNLGLFKIHFLTNTGAGFSILQGETLLLAIISLIVIVGLIAFYKKIPRDKVAQILFSMFLAGAIGNFIDRMFRKFVIDFIDFGWWPAFNVADMSITIAAIGLIIYYWREDKE